MKLFTKLKLTNHNLLIIWHCIHYVNMLGWLVLWYRHFKNGSNKLYLLLSLPSSIFGSKCILKIALLQQAVKTSSDKLSQFLL